MPRIVILTTGAGNYCEQILQGLANVEVIPDALCIISPGLKLNIKQFIQPHRFLGFLLRKGLRSIASRVKNARYNRDTLDYWEGYAERIYQVEEPNSQKLISILRNLQTDYLILAGSGIVKKEVLGIPKKGTVNVHPGLLPWVRGLGVVERALERHVPVGLTAHFVSAGIDTGEIIHRELVYVHQHDTLTSLRRRAQYRCAQVMVEIVLKAYQGKELQSSKQKARYPYCHWPSSEETAKIQQAVSDGLALKLYEKWRDFYGSAILPSEQYHHPSVNISPLDH